ncbi:MAG: universal stress protein [Pseudomonadota bacterium]
MFNRIMVPIDLAHADALGRALDTAADLARHYGIPVAYVGVTAETPTAVAHNPGEYAQKIRAFAEEQATRHGIAAEGLGYASHDPATDIDQTLLRAAEETGADLIVMASHIPGIADHFWPSHGGHMASRANASVFIVR